MSGKQQIGERKVFTTCYQWMQNISIAHANKLEKDKNYSKLKNKISMDLKVNNTEAEDFIQEHFKY